MKQFNATETLETCPGCGSRAFSVAYAPDVCRCETCQLLFRNPRPTQAEIAAAYDGGETYAEWHKQDAHYKSLWERRIQLVRSIAPAGGRLLDVGVGDGGFLSAASAAGYQCEGTELSQTGASFALEKGITVRMGQFTQLDWAGEHFDVITIWHVLEHVPDPGATIRHAYRLLKPGGALIVAVPNEDHLILRHRLFGRKDRPSPFDQLYPGCEIHLSHFQPHTLIGLLERANFTVERFRVDDYYPDRSMAKQLKVFCYQMLARLTRWHCAAAMLIVARR